jgi:hypothetical protein
MRSDILLHVAWLCGALQRRLYRIENWALASSWNAMRASGTGPWLIDEPPAWALKERSDAGKK